MIPIIRNSKIAACKSLIHFPGISFFTIAIFIHLTSAFAAVPGLPFTEDFSNTNLMNSGNSVANWNTKQQALTQSFRNARSGGLISDSTIGKDVSANVMSVLAIGIGDVDGDGAPDLVLADLNADINIYLNNGTDEPFLNAVKQTISSSSRVEDLALGDIDNDGDLDIITAKSGGWSDPRAVNLLYLNNGSATPFEAVTPQNITGDLYSSQAVVVEDFNGDGYLDVVFGNDECCTQTLAKTTRLYINNGTASPFEGVTGTNVSTDENITEDILAADFNGDSLIDILVINDTVAHKLYLNDGSGAPFDTAVTINVGTGADTSRAAIGDMDADGDIDIVVATYGGANLLYLNTGLADPFSGVVGINITDEIDYTYSIDVGDVDSDGDLDVVVGTPSGKTSKIFLNDGLPTPGFGTYGYDVSSDALTTHRVLFHDIDLDGDLDLVSANSDAASRYYINNRTANPFNDSLSIAVSTLESYTFMMELVDLNKDGDMDIVNNNYIYINNGTSSPFDGVTGVGLGGSGRSIATGDINGDGFIDIVLGNNSSQQNSYYLNNGSGTIFSSNLIGNATFDANDTLDVALGDVDNDGDLDLITANYAFTLTNGVSTRHNKLYLNNGTSEPFLNVQGIIIEPAVSSGYATKSIYLGDLNNDGNLDLISGSAPFGSRIYYGDGGSDPFNQASPITFGLSFEYINDIAAGDLDGDGDVDFITVASNPESNRLYINDGSSAPFNGITGEDISSDESTTNGVSLADIDMDGDLDILLAKTGHNTVILNNGTSSPFSDKNEINLSEESNLFFSIEAGDIDSDGDLDVVVGTGGVDSYYLNQSAASPVIAIRQEDIGTTVDLTRVTVLSDINDDGYPDLITGNQGVNNLYINNQTSDPFLGVIPTPITSNNSNTYGVQVGDLNNDGLDDLVVGNWSGSSYYYLNDGNGDPFDTLGGVVLSTGATVSMGVDIADINQDGRMDILLGNNSASIPNQILINNGSATPFSDAAIPIDGNDFYGTWSIKAVDMDLDGDLDIVTGNFGARNRIYINDGSNTFGLTSGYDITTDSHFTRVVKVGDVNGDGKPDLIAANTSQVNRLYLNDGSGNPFDTVSGSDVTADTDATFEVSLVDVDKDGDLDLTSANYNEQSKLYLNNGTSNPFNGVTGIILSSGTVPVNAASVADIDRDGAADIVLGSYGSISNKIISFKPFDNAKNFAESISVDTDTDILHATLTSTQTTPAHTSINWYLSNNGGANYYKVKPGVEFDFPELGDDLTWKAELNSLSPLLSPTVDTVNITARYDHDQDLVADDVDICVGTYDPAQLDNDGDAVPGVSTGPMTGGDACDIDDDNDGIGDVDDLFPFNYDESADTDGDCGTIDYNLTTSGNGCGDASDLDIDGDGLANGSDPFMFNVSPSINGSPATTATPGALYSFTPAVSDGGDGPSLSASLTFSGGTHVDLPSWLSFNTSTGALSGVPSNEDYGTLGNIVIVVSDGIQTASLAVFNINVLDTRAPQTFAVPGAGNFNGDATVTIACFENIGSGCASIHYTTDDLAVPAAFTVVSSQSTLITIPSSGGNANLRFYSVDADGNTENIKTESYNFDLDYPSISITTPASGSILTTVNSIDGTSSDVGTGIAGVAIQITDGTNSVQTPGGSLTAGAPAWIPVSSAAGAWSYNTTGLNWTSDVVYTITARAADNAGNAVTTSQSYTFYNTTPSTTSLALSLTSASIPNGEMTDAVLTFTRLNNLSADLTGVPLELHITRPDLTTVVLHGNTNFSGNLTFSQLGDGSQIAFNDPGQYQMVAKFTDTVNYPNLAAATSTGVNLLVGSSAGYAVIVQGKLPNNDGLSSHNKTANRIYNTLKDRGFVDSDIHYFNYDTNQTGVDGLPLKASIQSAIEGLAAEVASRPAPVYVIFVDHGGKATESLSARFFINDEIITPVELDGWLGTLETSMDVIDPQLVIDNPRIVIIGACYSGGFISDLSAAGRIIMTSATDNEQSFKGPLEDDNIRVGEYFLEELFLELGAGNDLRSAFKVATAKTETYTKEASGDVSINSDNEYLDTAVQHPLLDDDGSSAGTNAIYENTNDGQLAKNFALGFDQEALTNDAFNPAGIVSITATQYLADGVNTADLTLVANDAFQVNQAYVEIRTPSTTLASAVENTTEQLSSDFTRRAFTPPATQDAPYTLTYTEFNQPGKYEIFYYVNDRFTGALSPAKRGIIYRNRPAGTPAALDVNGINDAPTWGAGDLLSPTDGATGFTTTSFDWDDASDPDSDAISYTFILADDTSFNTFTQANADGSCTQINTAYRQEELTSSSTFVDAQARLCDSRTYVWKVEVVDAYGLIATSSSTFTYNTNDTNADIGVIVAMVKSATTNQQLSAANIINGFGESATASASVLYNGNYVLFTNHTGVDQTITASLAGYANTPITLAKGVASGETVEVLFDMGADALLDTDSDGVVDTADNCPAVANGAAQDNQLNTDGDAQGDACDTDDDADGIPDAYENLYAFLDPLTAGDATLDYDGDTISNLDEYRDGTDPAVFNVIPSDVDSDGIDDSVDNCVNDYNPSQIDTNTDGVGNVCDPDDDGDGMSDVFEVLYGLDPLNPSDANGDLDGDGFTNLQEFTSDTDPTNAPGTTTDIDSDGVFDAYDNCPAVANAAQTDTDGDGAGDDCDTDDDNDGVADVIDAFDLDATETLDTDGDGIGNNADADDDGDSVDDIDDAFPLNAAEWLDTDGDGVGNNADGDDDNDGVNDASDAFPLDSTESVDTDLNGIGNNADLDDDGDGVVDTADAFPLDAGETLDTDKDGIGNNSDTDDDGDGVPDAGDIFPLDATESVDTDADGIGNNADSDDDGDDMPDAFEILYGLNPLVNDASGDVDGDGVSNLNEYLGGTNPNVINSDTTDSDGDGFTDVTDNCPATINASQLDTDADGAGDACDSDDDNDGVNDASDAFPLDATESVDTDLDGIGNNADLDDDGDTVADTLDAFPLDASESVDTDRDGVGDNTDLDDDGDGVADTLDAFPLDAFETLDTDLDGIGNNADGDDDNDGMSDAFEILYGLDPLSDDANSDADGDGVINIDEFNNGTNPIVINSDTIDNDSDGVKDFADNCPAVANAAQTDTDGDTIGDACDPDDDNDGVLDASDLFPLMASESADFDGDGTGNNADTDDDDDGMSDAFETLYSLNPMNAADADIDTDGDGLTNLQEFLLGTNPNVINSDTIDSDGDGVKDVTDNCPADINASQLDTDSDGVGDACDNDKDNDGVINSSDAFPLDASESADADGDGTGNNADPDDDNDGMSDAFEILYGLDPFDPSDANGDLDNDGKSNLQEYQAGTSPKSLDTVADGSTTATSSKSSGMLHPLFLLALLVNLALLSRNRRGLKLRPKSPN